MATELNESEEWVELPAGADYVLFEALQEWADRFGVRLEDVWDGVWDVLWGVKARSQGLSVCATLNTAVYPDEPDADEDRSGARRTKVQLVAVLEEPIRVRFLLWSMLTAEGRSDWDRYLLPLSSGVQILDGDTREVKHELVVGEVVRWLRGDPDDETQWCDDCRRRHGRSGEEDEL